MNEKGFPRQYPDTMRLKEQGIKKLGMAVFIVDLETKKIWTVKENVKKPSTKREVGVLTIPLETRKVVRRRLEWGYNNVLGALDEFRELQPGEELIIIGFELDQISSFKGACAPFSWIYKITLNASWEILRNRKRDSHVSIEQ